MEKTRRTRYSNKFQKHIDKHSENRAELANRTKNIELTLLLVGITLFLLSFLTTELAHASTVLWVFVWLVLVAILLTAIKTATAITFREALAFKNKLVTGLVILNERIPQPEVSPLATILCFAGISCWLAIVRLEGVIYPKVFFASGFILFIWGFSLILEDTGIYKYVRKKVTHLWLLSLGLTTLLFWAGVQGAAHVNQAFPADPSHFPFTLSAMVVYNLLVAFSFAMMGVFIFVALAILYNIVISSFEKKNSEDSSGVLPLFLIFSLLVPIVGLAMNQKEIRKVYVKDIALSTDFNESHLCTNVRVLGKPVVFLGPNSRTVMVYSESDAKPAIEPCFVESSKLN